MRPPKFVILTLIQHIGCSIGQSVFFRRVATIETPIGFVSGRSNTRVQPIDTSLNNFESRRRNSLNTVLRSPAFRYSVFDPDFTLRGIQESVDLRGQNIGQADGGTEANILSINSRARSVSSRRRSRYSIYTLYPGFPPIELSQSDRDSCFMRIKSLFDQSYPRLPALYQAPATSNTSTLMEPIPKRLSELPSSMTPLYALPNNTDPVYVPFNIQNIDSPLMIPFERQTKRMVYPEYPIRIPYTKLAIGDPSGEREYVIQLPFQPDDSRVLECPPVAVPVLSQKGEFPNYALYYVRLQNQGNQSMK